MEKRSFWIVTKSVKKAGWIMFEIFPDEQWCLDDGGYHAFQKLDEKFDYSVS